jgi:hypothetical protein
MYRTRFPAFGKKVQEALDLGSDFDQDAKLSPLNAYT